MSSPPLGHGMVVATVTVLREVACQVCINVKGLNPNVIQCRCPMMLIFEVNDITCAQPSRFRRLGL